MKAVAYLRVSTIDQTDSGLGLEAQRAAVQAEAQRLGVELADEHIFVDAGISGGAELADCPSLVDALDALAKGDLLIVAKRDRLGRDVYRLALVERMAERAGARIVSADGAGNGDDPAALLMRRMVDAFAEYERALIKARTSAALRQKRKRNERVGAVRYGYKLANDGRTERPVSDEQATIRLAVSLRDQGLSLRRISAALAEQGRVSRTGRPFAASQVQRMLAA